MLCASVQNSKEVCDGGLLLLFFGFDLLVLFVSLLSLFLGLALLVAFLGWLFFGCGCRSGVTLAGF